MTARSSRRGTVILTIVLVLATLALMSAMLASHQSSDLRSRLARAMSGHEIEHLAFQSLEEAHYQLVMGQRPAASASEAASLIQAAMKKGAALPPEQDLAQPPPVGGRILDHDMNRFLREGTGTMYFAPVTLAATLSAAGGVSLGPIEVRVLDRALGKLAKAPAPVDGAISGLALQGAGLPLLMSELQTVWGILELRCETSANRGRSVRISRQASVRKLFMVANFTYLEESPANYGYVFPESIGRTLTRSKRWGIL